MKRTSAYPIAALLAAGLLSAALASAPHRITSAIYGQLVSKYHGRKPSVWGENMPGVLTHVHTDRKVVFLTFDACGGGKKGNGFDSDLIAYLEHEHIPATLFLSGRWIDANPEIARQLAENPLFEIENHGFRHKPCSVNGRGAYGIRGTSGIGDVIGEVGKNADKIEDFTHRRPRFYRSGTAMYDDVAASIVRDLGVTPVGFTINGDGGATLPKGQVKSHLLEASPGDIVLCHMNHPGGQTAEGIMAALPIMRKRGFEFAMLEEYFSRPEASATGGSTRPHRP